MTTQAAVLKPVAHNEKINIGLAATYREAMSKTLSATLASTYKLIIKNHVYHWNVVGPLFKPLHELTESHYQALFEAADVIAERIRALGHIAPADLSDTSGFTPDTKSFADLTAADMVADLVSDHESAVRAMRKAASEAGDAGDVVTEDMITQHLGFHEKALWMLRAVIAD